MATLTAYLQVIHTETGLWCDRCSLPSGVRVDVTIQTPRTLTPLTVARCNDCYEPLADP